MDSRSIGILNNNHLKIIAAAAMVCDHVGVALFPELLILRIIGRISLPIFAYMIAEGCTHTRSKLRYFLTIAVPALLCQCVYFVTMGSLYQNILVGFSLSVLTVICIDEFLKRKSVLWGLVVILEVAAVLFLSIALPYITGGKFRIDYGLFGISLPVIVYLCRGKRLKLCATAVCLVIFCCFSGIHQWYSLLSIPLLALYNGKRGTAKLKYWFYVFYPTHLVIIYLIRFLMIYLGN